MSKIKNAMEACPSCGGDGTTFEPDEHFPHRRRFVDCPQCDGRGTILDTGPTDNAQPAAPEKDATF